MKVDSKQSILRWAEILDGLRVYPRFVIVPFIGCWLWKMSWALVWWYIHEPPAGRGTQESAVLTGCFSACVGLITLIVNIYSKSGRDWNAQPIATSATVSSTTATQTSAPAS